MIHQRCRRRALGWNTAGSASSHSVSIDVVANGYSESVGTSEDESANRVLAKGRMS